MTNNPTSMRTQPWSFDSTRSVGQYTDKTRQDKTRQDKTRQDKTRQDKTRQDKTRHKTQDTRHKTQDTRHKTRQDKTRQDKTRQDKTRQDKTRQDKTRQDKTAVSTIDIDRCQDSAFSIHRDILMWTTRRLCDFILMFYMYTCGLCWGFILMYYCIVLVVLCTIWFAWHGGNKDWWVKRGSYRCISSFIRN